VKFESLSGEGYPSERLYTREEKRIVVWVPDQPVSLVRKLIAHLTQPLFLLYVLVVPRSIGAAGRYESTHSLTLDEAIDFLESHTNFLQGDGRHNFWVCSTEGSGRVVYDRHEKLFLYGDLRAYELVLQEAGFEKGEHLAPFPHAHYYNADFDSDQKSIVESEDFRWTPLVEGDDI
jgi:hypothetical protein